MSSPADREPTNDALVFIKPQACTDASVAFVRDFLRQKGCEVHAEGDIAAEEISSAGIVDDHYRALALYAMRTAPADLPVEAKRAADFEKVAGVSWGEAARRGDAVSLADAIERMPGVSAQELERQWREQDAVKLAPGLYAARVSGLGGAWVVNGFYASMRAKFVEPGTKVHYFLCSFAERALRWAEFRDGVIGATDPLLARAGSLRAELLARWRGLGIATEVRLADNAVHASAGPVEALAERRLWVWRGAAAAVEDPLLRRLLAAGVPRARADAWARNDVVAGRGGARAPAFDVCECVDTAEAVALIAAAEAAGGAPPAKRARAAAPPPPAGAPLVPP